MIYAICMECKNWEGKKHYKPYCFCKAYPNGIPEAILTGKHDHKKPYKGDNGITFTPIERAK